MRKSVQWVAACVVFSTPTQAHEFWIEPTRTPDANDGSVEMQVHVGEDFAGEVFRFEPRAYQAAYWFGPDKVDVLHTQPLAQQNLSLMAQGEGLHILAVASYETALLHDTVGDFLTFAHEVGASAVVADTPPVPDQNGNVRETYRRFSKTLLNTGGEAGTDKHLGFEYEWVQSPTGFTLYAGQKTAADHPVDVFCRQPAQQVTQHRMKTDADGHVAYIPARADRCLINAVFLTPPDVGSTWSSNWVSLVWDPKGDIP